MCTVWVSWQLTVFTIIFVPFFGWFMGFVGRKLKSRSILAQSLWSDTMSVVEETLGGLRIIKAFNAEKKMNARFDKHQFCLSQPVAPCHHPPADGTPNVEFLGTVMIIVVLWFGGILVLNKRCLTVQPSFITLSFSTASSTR
jgi:subfamily B ATP-binding cassette protein MsbA